MKLSQKILWNAKTESSLTLKRQKKKKSNSLSKLIRLKTLESFENQRKDTKSLVIMVPIYNGDVLRNFNKMDDFTKVREYKMVSWEAEMWTGQLLRKKLKRVAKRLLSLPLGISWNCFQNFK